MKRDDGVIIKSMSPHIIEDTYTFEVEFKSTGYVFETFYNMYEILNGFGRYNKEILDYIKKNKPELLI